MTGIKAEMKPEGLKLHGIIVISDERGSSEDL